ncbi:MAG: DUF4230 domain-containing protein [Bacteroidota bacterium]
MFLFKNPTFLLILIPIGFLLLIFLNKNKYLLWTIVLIVGIGVIGNLGRGFYKKIKKPFKPLSSTVVFKKMEYMEHLQLVSHYSEEIVLIGTDEKVRKLVKRLEEEAKNIQQNVSLLNDSILRYQAEIKQIFERVDNKQTEAKLAFESSLQIKLCVDNLSEKGIHRKTGFAALPCIDNWLKNTKDTVGMSLYTSYQSAYNDWKKLNDEFQDKSWKKKNALFKNWRERKTFKEKLGPLYSNLKKKHSLLVELLNARIDPELDKLGNEILTKGKLKKEKKKEAELFLTKLKAAEKELKRESKSLLNKEEKLSEARIELAYAEVVGEDIEPELLVILPAEVSVYLDMREVKIHEDSLEVGIVYVQLPELHFDPVLIDLPEDSAVYQLDKKKTELHTSRQGAYYDLFSQLKEGILELESEVKEKARRKGILDEGEKMAKTYLESFIAPMGFEIRFDTTHFDSLSESLPLAAQEP